MSGEKSGNSSASGAINGSSVYPDVPPPSYTAVAMPQPNITGAVQTHEFVALPAIRYDTMTSYTEDGSGVQTIITTGAVLDRPILIKCPFCRTTITTETKPTSGCLSWLCCIALSAIGCIYGCCLIPFYSKRLRDVEHTCPKCKNTVALYKRI